MVHFLFQHPILNCGGFSLDKLYYGKGDCSIQGNVSSLTINYRGAIFITSKVPDGYYIKAENNIIEINTLFDTHNLTELFSYVGEFKILSVSANDLQGENVSMTINRVMDYSELMVSNSEDITINSEDLNVGYVYGRKFKKTIMNLDVTNNLKTQDAKKDLYLGDEKYSGDFHMHSNGVIMTGKAHTKDSKILEIRQGKIQAMKN